MNLVDLDGKDWSRKWRHNSVTVPATVFADTKSMASAKQAASYWNNRKEDYYFIGDKSFRVLYDIIVVESPFLDNNQTDKNTGRRCIHDPR